MGVQTAVKLMRAEKDIDVELALTNHFPVAVEANQAQCAWCKLVKSVASDQRTEIQTNK